jgi:putative sporulation protein YtxC
MNQCIAVGAMQNAELVKKRLQREFKILEGEGIKIRLEENPPAGKLTFFFCWLADFTRCPYKKEDIPVIFKQYIAGALADLILEQWERQLLQQIIREKYFYFEPAEKEIIYQLALRYIDKGIYRSADELLCFCWKSKIFKKLLEFLRTHNQIVIEGFIRFRLKEYKRDLEEAAEKAVDDYLLEKEYKEFIQLLQYFIEIRKSRVDLLHVVFSTDRVFKLYNEQKQVIKSDSLEDIFDHLTPREIKSEDILFSILISLAPRQVIFHVRESKEAPVVLKTMKSIFDGRIQECTGCALCRQEDRGV